MMRILALFSALSIAASIVISTPALAEPAMWRVHDADTDITLFGTVHALPVTTTWLTPRITARFEAADTLVLETIIPDDPTTLAPLIHALGERSGLPPLASRVAPSKRAQLAASVAVSGLTMARLDGMETWLAAIALGDGTLAKLGLTSASGVEATLTVKAKAMHKTIVGLETPEAQLRLFDTLTETDQRALLDATVDDFATARADTDALIANWQQGATEALAADFDKELRATPALQAALLTNRNAQWADWIAAAMKRPGKMFIAVGAGHLAGRDSVIAMLRKKGITVDRLP